MKTYDEYTENIRKKAGKIKMRRRIALSTACACLALVLCVSALWPSTNADVPVDGTKGNDIINGQIEGTDDPMSYVSYQWLAVKIMQWTESDDDAWEATDGGFDSPADSGSNETQTYVEVTDNQVEGIIEGDCFKRSDKYLYYLQYKTLTAYSIDGLNSREAGSFDFGQLLEQRGWKVDRYASEMYLSGNGTTVTVICRGYRYEDKTTYCTAVISLDVSDPANIQVKNSQFFTGWNITSRQVDGDILLAYRYTINRDNMDDTVPETFVPTYFVGEEAVAMEAEDIYCADGDLQSLNYIVLVRLGGQELELQSMVALLGYDQEPIYVSPTTVYVTSQYTRALGEDVTIRTAQIVGVCYEGQTLEVAGSVCLLGTIGDQYYMDEYEGILRIAASTTQMNYKQVTDGENTKTYLEGTTYNCSLYCVDLSTWKVVATVENFAPEGDEVTSARFVGDLAYICTAEVELNTDPVYCFDLSDLTNITYKQTAIIDGYSTSLVDFGDHLLGIGTNGSNLKLEVYRQTESAVESVAVYERQTAFFDVYKCYYIDRENAILGMPIRDYATGQELYLLLQFDGEQFQVLLEIPVDWSEYVRATVIDGVLYVLDGELHLAELH